MLSLTTHELAFLSRKEFWFYNGEETETGSYNVFCFALRPPEKRNNSLTSGKTTCIDLSKSEDDLFRCISGSFQNEIEKGEKENFLLQHILHPTREDCESLISGYNRFAREMSIRPIPANRINALQRLGRLHISRIISGDSEVVTHAYLSDGKRIFLLNSFHNTGFRNDKLRSYANKYLHWKDILVFGQNAYLCYDFGGIDMENHRGISDFKLKFGGTIEENFSYITASFSISLLASMYKKIK